MALPSDWGTTAPAATGPGTGLGAVSGGLSGASAGPGLFGIGGSPVNGQLEAQGINTQYGGATIDPTAQAAWRTIAMPRRAARARSGR